jgi:hypothetical protein
MDNQDVVIRITDDYEEEFLSELKSEENEGLLEVRRVRTFRAAEQVVADILLTLASAGSLAALAAIIKAWLDRNRGLIEVSSEETGVKIKFEGPLDQIPLEDLQKMLAEPSRKKKKK